MPGSDCILRRGVWADPVHVQVGSHNHPGKLGALRYEGEALMPRNLQDSSAGLLLHELETVCILHQHKAIEMVFNIQACACCVPWELHTWQQVFMMHQTFATIFFARQQLYQTILRHAQQFVCTHSCCFVFALINQMSPYQMSMPACTESCKTCR